MSEFKGKNILVTGGTGTVGSELVRNLIKFEPNVIRVFSNDEDATFHLMHELNEYADKIRFLVGDIRDKDRLLSATEDIDIVYHAAALKHVPLCEYNPFDAVQTNVIGTENVIRASIQNNVDKVINISTDKAVNPINTMGATKLLTEKLVVDANRGMIGTKRTKLANVRFGNVLWSRGSVIPTFMYQATQGKDLTVTDPHMTRFFMSILDTTKLIFKATELCEGGEIFILKMPAVQIGDLAQAVINLYGPESHIKIIGLREGEKMYEKLMTDEEAKTAIDRGYLYIVPPRWKVKEDNNHHSIKKYDSSQADLLPIEMIEVLLDDL